MGYLLKNGYADLDDGQCTKAWVDAVANQVKVGDRVAFKYDVEQTGTVEKISRSWNGEKVLTVRAFDGGYVMNRYDGQAVDVGVDEIFGYWRQP